MKQKEKCLYDPYEIGIFSASNFRFSTKAPNVFISDIIIRRLHNGYYAHHTSPKKLLKIPTSCLADISAFLFSIKINAQLVFTVAVSFVLPCNYLSVSFDLEKMKNKCEKWWKRNTLSIDDVFCAKFLRKMQN